jgi:hypothetical protein
MRSHWLLVCLVFLAACSSPPQAAPLPTSQTLTVHYPAFMRTWTRQLRSCAANHPEVDWIEIEIPPTEADLETSQVLLWLGSSPLPAGMQAGVYEIGVEKWAIIVNAENPIRQISPDELSDIFRGTIQSWADLSEAGINFKLDIQVWSFPSSDPIASPYLDLLLEGGKLTSQAHLAPDPAAMLEAVADHKAAIGYLPSTWLMADPIQDPAQKSIHPIQANSDNLNGFSQPVLALTDHEPGGALRAILVCVQSKP